MSGIDAGLVILGAIIGQVIWFLWVMPALDKWNDNR